MQRNVLELFWREALLFDRFWSLSESCHNWAKNFGRLLNCISRVLSKTLRKKWLKYFSLLSSLLDFQWVFSDFGKKISQVCWNNNLSVLGKNVKKLCWTICFSSFFGFWQEKPVFLQESFWQGCQKTFDFPVEHIQIIISESKSWKLEDFWIIFEILGTMAENLFQGWQNSNRCPREQFLKFFFQKRKIRYFFRFWVNVYFQQKLSPELRNPQSMFRGSFWG